VYANIDFRLSQGQRVKFVDNNGKEIEVLFTCGCGWPGMD